MAREVIESVKIVIKTSDGNRMEVAGKGSAVSGMATAFLALSTDRQEKLLRMLWKRHQERLQADAPQQATPEPVGEPWGWAILDKHNATQSIRPRRQELFGCLQESMPLTAEDAATMDRGWTGLAPHRVVTLYTCPAPAAQAVPMTEGAKRSLISNFFSEGWAQEQAMNLLHDYDLHHGITAQAKGGA